MTESVTRPATTWFPAVAKVLAAVLFVFFGTGFVLVAADVEVGEPLSGLLRWGHDGRAYELMVCAIYLAWMPFLWKAADDPARNRLFLDFTLAGNAAHFGTMAVMGALMTGEHQHLYGDVLAGLLWLAAFTTAWLLARPAFLRDRSAA